MQNLRANSHSFQNYLAILPTTDNYHNVNLGNYIGNLGKIGSQLKNH